MKSILLQRKIQSNYSFWQFRGDRTGLFRNKSPASPVKDFSHQLVIRLQIPSTAWHCHRLVKEGTTSILDTAARKEKKDTNTKPAFSDSSSKLSITVLPWPAISDEITGSG